MKSKLILILLLLIATTNYSQEIESLILKAKNILEEGNYKFEEKYFSEAKGICERILAIQPDNIDATYYKAYSLFRIISLKAIKYEKKNFENVYQSCSQLITKLIEGKEYKSEGYVLKAGIALYKLMLNPMEGVRLSYSIKKSFAEAVKANSNNPRIYIIEGIRLLNTPPFYGGNPEKAKNSFQKAVSLFRKEKPINNLMPNWGKLEAIAWLGKSYFKLENPKEAKKIYEKILDEQPNYSWVKHVLLPEAINSEKPLDKTLEGTLIIKVLGFENDNGTLKLALNNSKENFLSNTAYKVISKKIENKFVLVKFRNLSYGEYAVSAFHDEDNDGQLNKGMFGIPTEAYGFSNNVRGEFGPPKYEDAKFKLNKEKTVIVINIK